MGVRVGNSTESGGRRRSQRGLLRPASTASLLLPPFHAFSPQLLWLVLLLLLCACRHLHHCSSSPCTAHTPLHTHRTPWSSTGGSCYSQLRSGSFVWGSHCYRWHFGVGGRIPNSVYYRLPMHLQEACSWPEAWCICSPMRWRSLKALIFFTASH
jgi:hypothetical protein